MSDCDATGGVHAFALTTTTTDADGRVTEYFRCRCGATQTITGPAGDAAGRRIGKFDDDGSSG